MQIWGTWAKRTRANAGKPARSARTSGFCRPRQPCTARTWWIVTARAGSH